MSFIVKGFDIPKDAVYFKLSFYDGNRENEYGISGSLMPYIIQISNPHGRLIDEREVKKAQFIINDQWGSYPVISLGNLNHVSTILEAEE